MYVSKGLLRAKPLSPVVEEDEVRSITSDFDTLIQEKHHTSRQQNSCYINNLFSILYVQEEIYLSLVPRKILSDEPLVKNVWGNKI